LVTDWLNEVKILDKARIRIGVSALCWAIWTSINDIVFNKQKGTHFLEVIRRATYGSSFGIFSSRRSAGGYGY
jgi:hypothetical protein